MHVCPLVALGRRGLAVAVPVVVAVDPAGALAQRVLLDLFLLVGLQVALVLLHLVGELLLDDRTTASIGVELELHADDHRRALGLHLHHNDSSRRSSEPDQPCKATDQAGMRARREWWYRVELGDEAALRRAAVAVSTCSTTLPNFCHASALVSPESLEALGTGHTVR
jgi:hypothetical protein